MLISRLRTNHRGGDAGDIAPPPHNETPTRSTQGMPQARVYGMSPSSSAPPNVNAGGHAPVDWSVLEDGACEATPMQFFYSLSPTAAEFRGPHREFETDPRWALEDNSPGIEH